MIRTPFEVRMARAELYGIKHQKGFEMVLDAMAEVRLDKCSAYGERRYENPDLDFNRWMCYSDVYRKFIRLEQQMKFGSVSDLRETYMDLANYAAMAIQLIDQGAFDV